MITKAVPSYRTPKAPPMLISKLNAIGFEKPARINRRCGDREKDGCAIFSKTISRYYNLRKVGRLTAQKHAVSGDQNV